MTAVTRTVAGGEQMLRTLIAGAGAGAVMTAGLATVPVAAQAYEPYGSTSARSQVLKPRCDYYHYRYSITVPTDNWAAEVFLIGPRGGRLASRALLPVSDPRTGRDRFRMCRPSLIAGRYKIRMKVTFKIGYDKFEGFVKPSYFRLVRRR